MWTDHDSADMTEEFRELMMNDESACFIKYVDEKTVAFARCQLRHDYVERTKSSPVGYLEGIFVAKEYRLNGFAADLLAECEKWAGTEGNRGKVFGGVYDDRLLIKPVPAALKRMPDARMELPYDGAKEMIPVDDVDNRRFLCELIESMWEELPEKRQPKKPEKRRLEKSC